MADLDTNNFPPLGSAAKETKEPDEEWELLSAGAEAPAENDIPAKEEKAKTTVVQGNPKMLRHCASSPDLRCFDHSIYEEDEEDEHKEAEDSSYGMLSTPGSVITWGSGLSFKDALKTSTGKEQDTTSDSPISPSRTPRPFRKPRIIVKAPSIRRCSQSSPNLMGLIQEDQETVMGETDAAEFYHRKAKGAQGRSNGLKLRPDEAKRKQYAVNKRDIQRQASLK